MELASVTSRAAVCSPKSNLLQWLNYWHLADIKTQSIVGNNAKIERFWIYVWRNIWI